MGRVDGKVAFITGAARGQGRSHAVRLAEEGADIIAIDICARVDSNVAPPATEADLAETVRLVEALGRRILASTVDVRDFDGVKAALTSGVAELGRLDIVVANAGVWTYGKAHELTEKEWQETLDVVLTGVWHTTKAATPFLIDQGQGGSIVITSSAVGLAPNYHLAHYSAAKHGTVGLMKTLAIELAEYSIRVNTVNPSVVNTELVHNKATYDLFAPDIAEPTRDQIADRMRTIMALPIPWVEPVDISNAVLFLSSEEARYITGVALPVDGGTLVKP